MLSIGDEFLRNSVKAGEIGHAMIYQFLVCFGKHRGNLIFFCSGGNFNTYPGKKKRLLSRDDEPEGGKEN